MAMTTGATGTSDVGFFKLGVQYLLEDRGKKNTLFAKLRCNS